jgi:hypothetical protein
MLSIPANQEVGLEKITRSKLHSGINADFYLHEHNTIVEVHGIQHYQVQSFGADDATAKMNYSKQLYRDDRLREICTANNIKLIEIPYDMTHVAIMSLFASEIL